MNNIIGHTKEKQKLKMLFDKGSVPHGFVFLGPDGVGKRTVARWYLKMINCESSQEKPCFKCSSCTEIEEGVHCDILEIFPEKKQIEVEQIEVVREKVAYRGLKANYKGIIIDSAHLMNSHSQNALLKTLEEPTKNTVIILVTESPNALFETTLSRTVQIEFNFATKKEMKEAGLEEEIIELSMNRPGRALKYLENKDAKKKAESIFKIAKKIDAEHLVYRFSEVKKLTKEGTEEDVQLFIEYFLQSARENLIDKINRKESTAMLAKIIKEMEEVVFLKSKTNASLQLMIEKTLILN